MSAFRRGAVLAAGLLVVTAAARAQDAGTGGALRPARSPAMTSSQFMGSFQSSVTLIADRESLEAEVKEARIRLGPLKLRPILNIGNLGWTDNFYGTTSDSAEGDFTATVEGGVKAIVPAGSRLFVRGSVLPAYTWYSTNSDRSTFGGTYDASAYYYLSRFSFEARAGSYTSTVNLSSEVEQPVKQDVLAGQFRAQYELGTRTALVGDLNLARRRYGGAGLSDEDLATLAKLDGSDAVWSVGVRRKVGGRLLLGVSYEQGDLAFVNEGELRDARSTGVMGSAYLEKSRLEVNVYLGYRDFRPKGGSSFVPWNGPSGGGTVGYALSRLFSAAVFARSNLIASLYTDNAVYDERRAGATLGISPRWATFWATWETGANRYVSPTLQPDGSSVTRRDDVKTIRGGVRGHVGRLLTIGVEASQEDYTSNLPGFDRSIFRIGTTVGFGPSGRIDILR
ncbi:MAG: hypothetical protein U0529_02005 [Thermoanaerobaculia bacterium]